MKKKLFLVVLGMFLALALGENLSGVQVARAQCTSTVEGGHNIAGSFNVRDCLTTEGQINSKFVPNKEEKNADGTLVADPVRDAGQNTIAGFLVDGIDYFVKIIGSVALVVFIIGAIMTVTSQGKEDQLEKGKTAMMYSLIGLGVALFSFLIVTFVQSIFF